MRVFVSWSGGKESSLSLYRVIQDKNIKPAFLLNMISKDGKHSRTHGINSKLLRLQAEAIGISLVQRKTTWGTYEEQFKKAIAYLKKENIQAGVFGDIDLQEHRDWVEKVCKNMNIRPILPLWKEKREELLKEFINSGFKAIVIATQSSFLPSSCLQGLGLAKKWLGRKIDNEFVEELKVMDNIDLCGEKGEYHTFVYDGPIFKSPVEFTLGRKILRDKHYFLEVVSKTAERIYQ